MRRVAYAAGPAGPGFTVPSFFADVDPEGFYADAVDHCYTAGYIKGTTRYTFEPDA